MSDIAVAASRVSKRYRVFHERRQTIKEIVLRRGRGRYLDLWALKDVSFEVPAGKTFGIIGSNGSGKSTMLKLLTGIMPPTSGELLTRGRLCALLELGAGFHPELTGRENVFFNGSILGLTRKQLETRLDDIIQFSGLEESIDAPIRTYSSGMYVRLGFSVAIHSDPQVLLVDEVLSVGDESFQRRSAHRILQMREEGVTIVFVSHSLDLVRGLCDSGIWLSRGEVAARGTADEVVRAYLRSVEEGPGDQFVKETFDRHGTGEVEIIGAEIYGESSGQPVRTGEPAKVVIKFSAPHRVDKPVFGIAIHRVDGFHITGPNTRDAKADISFVEGPGEISFEIRRFPLMPGAYELTVAAADYTVTQVYDLHDRAYPFEVLTGDLLEPRGIMAMDGTWTVGSGGEAT